MSRTAAGPSSEVNFSGDSSGVFLPATIAANCWKRISKFQKIKNFKTRLTYGKQEEDKSQSTRHFVPFVNQCKIFWTQFLNSHGNTAASRYLHKGFKSFIRSVAYLCRPNITAYQGLVIKFHFLSTLFISSKLYCQLEERRKQNLELDFHNSKKYTARIINGRWTRIPKYRS